MGIGLALLEAFCLAELALFVFALENQSVRDVILIFAMRNLAWSSASYARLSPTFDCELMVASVLCVIQRSV
jgi:hypothetical protein